MPTYMSECRHCGLLYGEHRKIKDYQNTPNCSSCGERTTTVILAAPPSFIKGKFDPFISPVDRSLVRSQRELNEHNKRNGVQNLHDGYSEKELAELATKPRATPKIDKKEVSADIIDAIREVEHGYKPTIGAQDD